MIRSLNHLGFTYLTRSAQAKTQTQLGAELVKFPNDPDIQRSSHTNKKESEFKSSQKAD